MKKILKCLKKLTLPILLAVILLAVQAQCDLALPDYMSDVVNVGIQQGGIENATPEKIREREMEYLLMFTDEDEAILSAYTLSDGVYTLNDTSHKNKEAQSDRFTMPMVCVSMLRAGGDEMKAALTASLPEGSYDPSAEAVEILYSLPEQIREPMAAQLLAQFSEYLTLGTMVDQMAVEYVKTEYEAVGMDLDGIQMRYIMTAGLKMLGFSLLIVAAAILISLFASRVAAKFGESLRLEVFRQVVSFSGREFNEFSTASLITRSTNDIQQIQMLVVMLLRMVLYTQILGIGALLKIGGSGMTLFIITFYLLDRLFY